MVVGVESAVHSSDQRLDDDAEVARYYLMNHDSRLPGSGRLSSATAAYAPVVETTSSSAFSCGMTQYEELEVVRTRGIEHLLKEGERPPTKAFRARECYAIRAISSSTFTG